MVRPPPGDPTELQIVIPVLLSSQCGWLLVFPLTRFPHNGYPVKDKADFPTATLDYDEPPAYRSPCLTGGGEKT